MKPIGLQYRQYISNQGKTLLKQVETENAEGKALSLKEILEKSQVVKKLLAMLDTHLHVVSYCFEGNPLFEMQRSSGFESFVNFELGKFTLSEMLSTYSDQVLRKNGLKAD